MFTSRKHSYVHMCQIFIHNTVHTLKISYMQTIKMTIKKVCITDKKYENKIFSISDWYFFYGGPWAGLVRAYASKILMFFPSLFPFTDWPSI